MERTISSLDKKALRFVGLQGNGTTIMLSLPLLPLVLVGNSISDPNLYSYIAVYIIGLIFVGIL